MKNLYDHCVSLLQRNRIERGRKTEREREKQRERQISFKELAHALGEV